MLSMRKRLGEILLEKRMVDGRQLNSALAHQRSGGAPLGQVLLDLRLCTSAQLLEALAQQTGVPALDLDRERLDPALAAQVPRRLAERHRVVPLRLEGPRGTVLVVAIAAPASLQALEAVRTVTNKSWVVPRLVTDEALSRALRRMYAGPSAWPDPLPPEPGLPLLPELCDSQPDPAPRALAEAPPQMPPEMPPDTLPDTLPDIVVGRACEAETDARGAGPVLVYGWREGVGESLVRLLSDAGLAAALAGEREVLAAAAHALVLTPLPWLEALPRRPRSRLLVAGKQPRRDEARALRLGAHGFVAAPLDERRLLSEVRRLLGARS